ncbi:hypothetical protein [Nitrobacter hamburgensis]|uniref:hypothetical protein n=1 Tax=Nitrobacter hamburgensis TaxID=912 RepID=UPI0012EEC085
MRRTSFRRADLAGAHLQEFSFQWSPKLMKHTNSARQQYIRAAAVMVAPFARSAKPHA